MLDNYCQCKEIKQATGWEEIPCQSEDIEMEAENVDNTELAKPVEPIKVVETEKPVEIEKPAELAMSIDTTDVTTKAVFPEITKETETTVKTVKIKKTEESVAIPEVIDEVKVDTNEDKKTITNKKFVTLNNNKKPSRPAKSNKK